jgi:mono/diheme cytochrome c family protein
MKSILSSLVFGSLILGAPLVLRAQSQPTPSQRASTKGLKLDTGEEIFKASCIGCHGANGVGQDESVRGFEAPDTFPDFTDCNGSTRERTADWSAIIHEGGPIRGFSEIMPSWKDALTDEQIDKVVGYLRSRCNEAGWPLGELNLPRTLFTEKAFPEDEYVLTSTINTQGAGEVSGELVYEKRFGRKNQLEFAAPYGFLERNPNSWVGGIGDLVLGYKRNLFSTLKTGSILSLQGEVAIPTGNKSVGLGSGITTFETFAAFGQLLPGTSFLQMQSGFELPTDTAVTPNAFFWRTAIGKTFTQKGKVGRAWTPMVEFLSDRDLVSGAKTNWDIVPEFQVTLNKRQHVRLGIGYRRPLNNTAGRSAQIAIYALWDFFDGGLRAGW